MSDDNTEVTIVVDVDGEPHESLVSLFKTIVDLINEHQPHLEARFEMWEPAHLEPGPAELTEFELDLTKWDMLG